MHIPKARFKFEGMLKLARALLFNWRSNLSKWALKKDPEADGRTATVQNNRDMDRHKVIKTAVPLGLIDDQ